MDNENNKENERRLNLYLKFMRTPVEETRLNWNDQNDKNNDNDDDDEKMTMTEIAIRKWYDKLNIQPSSAECESDDESAGISPADLISKFDCTAIKKIDKQTKSENKLISQLIIEDYLNVDNGANDAYDADDPGMKLADLNVSKRMFKEQESQDITKEYCEFLKRHPDLAKPAYLVNLGMFEDTKAHEQLRKS